MEKKEIIELLIEQEIRWCKNNFKTGNQSKEFKNGFINGLKQAIYLIKIQKK